MPILKLLWPRQFLLLPHCFQHLFKFKFKLFIQNFWLPAHNIHTNYHIHRERWCLHTSTFEWLNFSIFAKLCIMWLCEGINMYNFVASTIMLTRSRQQLHFRVFYIFSMDFSLVQVSVQGMRFFILTVRILVQVPSPKKYETFAHGFCAHF